MEVDGSDDFPDFNWVNFLGSMLIHEKNPSGNHFSYIPTLDRTKILRPMFFSFNFPGCILLMAEILHQLIGSLSHYL